MRNYCNFRCDKILNKLASVLAECSKFTGFFSCAHTIKSICVLAARVNVSKLYGLKKKEIISMIHSQQQHLLYCAFHAKTSFCCPTMRCDCVLAIFFRAIGRVLNAEWESAAYLSSAGVEAPVALTYLLPLKVRGAILSHACVKADHGKMRAQKQTEKCGWWREPLQFT